ncbi:hypothetical protein PybrP1_002719 [[Pythium] brassicae (nom. inval.)]|nr:hypothetical protein PybrP1_002719 [[Pythium] brassicae (nom. inval.)]
MLTMEERPSTANAESGGQRPVVTAVTTTRPPRCDNPERVPQAWNTPAPAAFEAASCGHVIERRYTDGGILGKHRSSNVCGLGFGYHSGAALTLRGLPENAFLLRLHLEPVRIDLAGGGTFVCHEQATADVDMRTLAGPVRVRVVWCLALENNEKQLFFGHDTLNLLDIDIKRITEQPPSPCIKGDGAADLVPDAPNIGMDVNSDFMRHLKSMKVAVQKEGHDDVGLADELYGVATAFTNVWRAKLGQDLPTTVESRGGGGTTTMPEAGMLESLDGPITTIVVVQAIRLCKRGKTQGPNELPNDLYWDLADELLRVLEVVFNVWLDAGVTPAPFASANVHCLKKLLVEASSLDHRPIALLNTDNKIFTRIFARRLGPLLPQLIYEHQARFVPGQSTHATIDTYLTAQDTAASGQGHTDVLCLRLDFQKAYDSLNLGFLEAALAARGFPSSFVRMVATVHCNTSGRFLVNGYLSRSHSTYSTDNSTPATTFAGSASVGAPASSSQATRTIRDPTMADACLQVIRDFGDVSDHRVNVSKSIAIRLAPIATDSAVTAIGSVPALPRGTTCRYLGIHVGVGNAEAANRDGMADSLRHRLRFARTKTHTVIQRAEIARAIIAPKLAYVARHSWPAPTTVRTLQDFVNSFVWGSHDRHRKRAWLGATQVGLALRAGGIGMPNVKAELLALAAFVVGTMRGGARGVLVCEDTRRSGKCDTVRGSGPAACGAWSERAVARRRVSIGVGELLAGPLQTRATERKGKGRFRGMWLQHCSTQHDGWLLDRRGDVMRLSRLAVPRGATTLGEILSWTWVERGVIQFSYLGQQTPLSAASRRILLLVCLAMKYNFPGMLNRRRGDDDLVPYDAEVRGDHDWRLREGERVQRYIAATMSDSTAFSRGTEIPVIVTRQVERRSKFAMHAHPRFSHLVQVWGGGRPWRLSRKSYRYALWRGRIAAGEAQRDAAAATPSVPWLLRGPVEVGMAVRPWSELLRSRGLNTYEKHFLYRHLAGKISGWNVRGGTRYCPHAECAGVARGLQLHVFWECLAAQRLWGDLRSR